MNHSVDTSYFKVKRRRIHFNQTTYCTKTAREWPISMANVQYFSLYTIGKHFFDPYRPMVMLFLFVESRLEQTLGSFLFSILPQYAQLFDKGVAICQQLNTELGIIALDMTQEYHVDRWSQYPANTTR